MINSNKVTCGPISSLQKKKKVTQSTANVFQESKVFQQTMFLYMYSKLYTKNLGDKFV